jgi:hypothetical protein
MFWINTDSRSPPIIFINLKSLEVTCCRYQSGSNRHRYRCIWVPTLSFADNLQNLRGEKSWGHLLKSSLLDISLWDFKANSSFSEKRASGLLGHLGAEGYLEKENWGFMIKKGVVSKRMRETSPLGVRFQWTFTSSIQPYFSYSSLIFFSMGSVPLLTPRGFSGSLWHTLNFDAFISSLYCSFGPVDQLVFHHYNKNYSKQWTYKEKRVTLANCGGVLSPRSSGLIALRLWQGWLNHGENMCWTKPLTSWARKQKRENRKGGVS